MTVLKRFAHRHLKQGSHADIEMVVKPGRGYVSAERNKEEGLPIGVIPVDSIFTPVTLANFHVENAGWSGHGLRQAMPKSGRTAVLRRAMAVSSAALILRDAPDIFIHPDQLGETNRKLSGKKSDGRSIRISSARQRAELSCARRIVSETQI